MPPGPRWTAPLQHLQWKRIIVFWLVPGWRWAAPHHRFCLHLWEWGVLGSVVSWFSFCFLQMMYFCWLHQAMMRSLHWGNLQMSVKWSGWHLKSKTVDISQKRTEVEISRGLMSEGRVELMWCSICSDRDTVLICCCEERAECESKVSNLPVALHSYPRLLYVPGLTFTEGKISSDHACWDQSKGVYIGSSG